MHTRIRQAHLFTVVAATSVAVLAGTAFAQSSNLHVGTWKLDVAKSKYSPGPATKSGITKIEAVGAGVKYTVDQVTGDGTVRHWEFTANYDGKDSPVTGNSADADTITLTRVNANTVQLVNKKSGKVTTTQTSVVSPDGKTRTITTKGTNTQGQTVNNVVHYDRQ